MFSVTFEKTRQFILLCIYTLCPPFYMMSLTYLLNEYRGGNQFEISDIIPVFWGTIWIPALLGLIFNFLGRWYIRKRIPDGTKLRDFPLLFILIYSVYFIILGQFRLGTDCLYGGVSGIMLVFFVWLFRESVRKCVEYLPVTEKVYLYMVVFLFPILVLIITDIFSIIEERNFYMTVLLSPVIYIGGVSLVLIFCGILRLWCAGYKVALKKNVYSLRQVILLLLIGDNLLFLYLIPYIGNLIILIGLLMSTLLYTFETVYDVLRRHRLHCKTD